MTIEQLTYFKESKGYSLDKLAELSGVPRGTLQKIFSGETRKPRYETLQAIEKVLVPNPISYEEIFGQRENDSIAEAATAYGCYKIGPHTLEDYYALPEDQRVELIDGEFFVMDAPSTIHQIVSFKMCYQIQRYIDEKKGGCIPLMAPTDVQLDCDDKTMVQPDVMILCDRSKLIRRCIMGAPDFIVEVLSKATKKKDSLIKTHKYENAGVREYWMVDTEKERVLVYTFEEDTLPTIYGANDEIPVKIYDGDLKITMKEIFESIKDIE